MASLEARMDDARRREQAALDRHQKLALRMTALRRELADVEREQRQAEHDYQAARAEHRELAGRLQASRLRAW